jgi:hypothetical protein
MSREATSMSVQRISEPKHRLPADDDPDTLDSWERRAVGKAARLHFPLRDVLDLGRISAELRHLSNRLELLAKSKEPAFWTFSKAKDEIRLANERMAAKPKSKMPL